MPTKPISKELPTHQRYALLLVDKENKTQIVQVFTRKGSMDANHKMRKNAGESGLIRSRILIQIETVY